MPLWPALEIDADSGLGAATGLLVLAGGQLRAAADLATAASRPLRLDSAGGSVDPQGHTLTINGPIGGPGSLSKTGSGTLVLAAANTYGGATTLTEGTLSLAHASALPADTAVVLGNAPGLVLALQADAAVGSLAGGGAVGGPAGGAAAELALGAFTVHTGGNGADTVFAGNLSGPGGLVKQGSGRFTLAGRNTYTGTSTVAAGTLALQGGAALADGATVVLADAASAVLALHDAETIGALAGGAADAQGRGGGQLQLGSSTLSTGGAGTDSSFAGVVSGGGRLVKQGAGSFTLSAVNTYSGGAQVLDGVLAIDHDGQLGAAPAAAAAQQLLLDGGTLRIDADTRLAATRGLWLGDAGGTLDVRASVGLNLPGAIGSEAAGG